MFKAYNRVNRKFLYKALQRICLPNEFIILLKNSLEGRINHIITAVGNTDEYNWGLCNRKVRYLKKIFF